MRYKYIKTLENLKDNTSNSSALIIVPREKPILADDFFSNFKEKCLKLSLSINHHNAENEINAKIKGILPESVTQHDFYDEWVNDMGKLVNSFCKFIKQDSCILWLTSERVCKKFHVDKTPWRLLITYYGAATKWTESPLREVQQKNEIDIKSLNVWDVAILQGGTNGIVHKSPETEYWSILVRLDCSGFK